MRLISPRELIDSSAKSFGLGDGANPLSKEYLTATIRRTASFLAPCSTRKIINEVSRCLRGLPDGTANVEELVASGLESVISYGDLIELREETDSGSTAALINLAPPSFVQRRTGMVFLVGMAPDRDTAIPLELAGRIQYAGHTRRLMATEGENLVELLKESGLIELPETAWIRTPRIMDSRSLSKDLSARLESSPTSGDISGLRVLDPATSPTFYKGRWAEPKRQTGTFVARRDQQYGAPLWCFVYLDQGRPTRLVDLLSSEWPGWDQAWHLQMAIDANRGTPQRYRIDRASPSSRNVTLTFFSPIPSWATRRLDSIGEPAEPRNGLFAYDIRADELPEERRFLETRLWLATT
jgi:hypothetical protein